MHCLSSVKAATLDNPLAWQNNSTSSRLVKHGNLVWFAVWKLREKLSAVEQGQQRVFDVTFMFQSAKMSRYCTSSFYRLERKIGSAENPLSVSWGSMGIRGSDLASKASMAVPREIRSCGDCRLLRRPPPLAAAVPRKNRAPTTLLHAKKSDM
jgi:hypothetical protein